MTEAKAQAQGGCRPVSDAPATIERIRARIRAHRYRPIAEDEKAITHAVLVPFYALGGEMHIVLTKRTDTVSMQQGHIAFPGGRRART